jgi:ASPIC and UnbV/Secretion system C-terminal sorting domain/FG-GAP-like repeat
MKTILLFLLFILNSSLFFAQDTCINAQTITAGSFVVNAVNGTQIPNPICAASGAGATAGKWYSFTPTANYTVTVTTELQININLDTRFHVYSGTCGNLVCVGGDDDGGTIGTGYLSIGSFAALANTTYYIAFDNRWSSSEFTFEVNLSPYVAPPIPIPSPVTFAAQNISTIGSSYDICIVDMNGDYLDDLVGVSAGNIKINYQNASGGFTVATKAIAGITNMPSWSLAAGDFNKDGFNDLVLGGGNGVSFLKSGAGGASYTASQTTEYVFSQRSNFVDINNDGNLDAFVCHDVNKNVYYINNGSGGLTYNQGGLGDHTEGGNYGSIWVDYDNDGDSDLFIAKCRGGSTTANINELHRNNGNGTFTNVALAANLADPIQTWSSAWGDFDNDGDMDVLVGANAISNGTHKLMRNNLDGTFTDITAGSGWPLNSSFGREHVAQDFDNDGKIDVMGGGNKIMYNTGNMTFSPNAIPATSGPIGDLNNDGFLDIQNGNNIFFNSGNANKWIKIKLQGNQSNRNGIGARVEIYGAFGKQIRDVRSGDGFQYMSTLNAHFGIGTATAITQLIVRWPSGVVDVINNPTVNQSILVIEASSPLKVQGFENSNFTIFPNPTSDILNISLKNKTDIKNIEIYDISGKLLETKNSNTSVFDTKNLSSGSYIILLQDSENKLYSEKFIKK